MDRTFAATLIQAAFRGYRCRNDIKSLWDEWLDQVRAIEKSPNLYFGHHLSLLIDHQLNHIESGTSICIPENRVVYLHGNSPYACSIRRPGEKIPANSIIGPSLLNHADNEVETVI